MKGALDIHSSNLILCNYIFIKTKTIDVLRQRLIRRGTETEESLARRLKNAQQEIETAEKSKIFSKFFINEEKEALIRETEAYIMKELY